MANRRSIISKTLPQWVYRRRRCKLTTRQGQPIGFNLTYGQMPAPLIGVSPSSVAWKIRYSVSDGPRGHCTRYLLRIQFDHNQVLPIRVRGRVKPKQYISAQRDMMDLKRGFFCF